MYANVQLHFNLNCTNCALYIHVCVCLIRLNVAIMKALEMR